MNATKRAASQSTRRGLVGGKHGPYSDPEPWPDGDPYCVYFYYALPNPPTYPIPYDVTAYYHDEGAAIPRGNLDGVVASLVANARNHGTTPLPSGKSLGAIPWRRISWIVIVLDDTDDFVPGNAVSIGWGAKPNHTFFGGGEQRLTLPGGDSVAMFWVKNHMRDENGAPLGNASETFHFHFNSHHFSPFWTYPDENGTNIGPRIGPP